MRYSIIHPQIHTFSSVTFRLHGNGSRHIWIVVHFQPRFNFVFDRFKWNYQSYESHDHWHSVFWKLCICKLSDWYTDRYACNVRISGNSENSWFSVICNSEGPFLFTEQNLPKMFENKYVRRAKFHFKIMALVRLFLGHFPISQPWYGDD